MEAAFSRRLLLRGMVIVLLGSSLVITMLTPIEPVDLLYFILTSQLNVAPEVLVIISDILILLAGFLIAASLRIFLVVGATISDRVGAAFAFFGSVNRGFNWKGVPSLVVAACVIAFWHVPWVLDAALLSYDLHWVMHVSIFFAGAFVYLGFTRLTLGMRLLTYLLGCKAMLILGAYMLVSPVALYGTYPYPEQLEAGAAMVAMCLASDVTIIPLWARRYFTNTDRSSGP
jgi:cytochrome c oxidase assembly factor CtaG